MRDFNYIVRPDTPMAMSVVVKPTDKNKLAEYEEFCYNSFGKKCGENPETPTWYQSCGYFFFATKALAAQFILGMTDGTRNAVKVVSQDDRNSIGGLYNRLYSEFQTPRSE